MTLLQLHTHKLIHILEGLKEDAKPKRPLCSIQFTNLVNGNCNDWKGVGALGEGKKKKAFVHKLKKTCNATTDC